LTTEQNNINKNSESKQAKVGKKRIQKNQRKLLDDNKNLRTKVNSLQRLNIKKSDGQNVNPEVRKTLILHEVMVQQLKSRSSKFKPLVGKL
jgi:hypothetical protein